MVVSSWLLAYAFSTGDVYTLLPKALVAASLFFFWAKKEQDSQNQQDWDLQSPMYGSIVQSTASGQAKALFEQRCVLRCGEEKS